MTRHRSNGSARAVNKLKTRVKKGVAALLLLLDEWDGSEDGLLDELLRKQHATSQAKHDAAKNRKCRQRTSWSSFQNRLTNKQFRRYFRMERECFHYLCDRIIANVGEGAFKSEEYLYEMKHGYVVEDRQANILHAHEHTTGGFVSGEVKLALTLRHHVCQVCCSNVGLDVGDCNSCAVLHNPLSNFVYCFRFVLRKILKPLACSIVSLVRDVKHVGEFVQVGVESVSMKNSLLEGFGFAFFPFGIQFFLVFFGQWSAVILEI